MKINPEMMEWTREPKQFAVTENRVEIITEPHTDLWQRTYYHFRNDNAPALQMKTREKYFSFVVKTEFDTKVRYDQSGIIMYLDSDNWLKAAMEYENESIQRLGSVVTNNGYSDWASVDVDASIKSAWFRLSRREDDFCVEYSADGVRFKQMRICHMFNVTDEVQFGIYACSAEDGSFTASFTHMEMTECQWKAHDGQQPEEKQWVLGMGEIGHINSRWQKEHGVGPVDIDEFVNDWQLRTNNRSDYRLIRTYAEQCGDCFDWFIEPLTQEERDGIHPMLTPPSPHMPKALNGFRAWPGTPNMGVALMTRAVKENQHIAKEHGARFFFGTRACQLTKENGAVTGVVGQLPGGEYVQFRAKKGVILAAGDYSKNPDMCRDLLSEADDLSDGDITGHGWDGSGIRMGVWAGGRLEPRSHAAMGGNYSFPGFDLIGSAATLRVNCHGKRYSNEGFGTHILAATTGAKQPNGMLWGIFDSNIRDELTYQAPNHAVFDYTDPAEIEKLEHSLAAANKTKGNAAQIKDKAGAVRPLYCADTLEELAGILFAGHADRENFLRTVERYNEMCRCGQDKDFGKDPALLHPVQKPPFYACGNRKDSHQPGGQSLKLLVTVSGLLIDENQQVLDHDFEPISGLYATGNCSGCRFGFQYTTSLPGQSISIAQTLGRILGSRLAGKEIS